ncbi:MAG TPA: glycine--tRNA ligase subunit beta [Allosphingosinicella sp.]|jgi:glycyl-tRNA synthetase beta chain
MPDFLLELRSEEIPARMQAKAEADLACLFAEQIGAAGLYSQGVQTYATPRRLALIARGLPERTEAVREETKGPRTSAPPQALDGFLRKTGLTRDQLEERDGIWFAVAEKPGRSTRDVLAQAIPAIIRAFPWPKSMRWGAASTDTASLRWVRPLQGIVALLGEEIVPVEIAGIVSGAATVGHRFHHPGIITIGSAADYLEKLRACHVIVDPAERRRIIAEGARAAAAAAGLSLVEDEGLLAENAGLTEWPVPLLGSFDPAFLDVPPEVIQLTMRTNQKYFALKSSPGRGGGPAKPVEGVPHLAERVENPLHHPTDGPRPRPGEDQLAPNFICTANIDASDGGAAIVHGNRKVLAARLSDAKFFWEQDLKVPLEQQADKLAQIVFHEKLGTVADKVERVAKLARWLVEEGIVGISPSPRGGEGASRSEAGEGLSSSSSAAATLTLPLGSAERAPPSPVSGEGLADLATRAARLCKADLVTSMVGEFPELQGIIGGHLARAQGEHPRVADAIRDHYKPVGQGDEVPTAPVTVAVSLADKLDTVIAFFGAELPPTGSKDPFALRRSALGIIQLITANHLRIGLLALHAWAVPSHVHRFVYSEMRRQADGDAVALNRVGTSPHLITSPEYVEDFLRRPEIARFVDGFGNSAIGFLDFFADRLKVQQREAGVRHDLIDAVFALGGEDDLVRLLARVRALQAFVETAEGADLLAGYKRAANILKKEGYSPSPETGEGQAREAGQGEGRVVGDEEQTLTLPPGSAGRVPPSPLRGEGQNILSYTPEPEEAALIAALDSAEPRARAAVEAEAFEGAMAALASLRGPVDAFFDKVTVNDPDPAKRDARLALLARMRDAVHQVADFSRIEG